MDRKRFIWTAGLGLGLQPWRAAAGMGGAANAASGAGAPGGAAPAHPFITPGLSQPVTFYNDWSSYDELSDNTPLTETLAMREMEELVRLQHAGVHIDYYMMEDRKSVV